MAAAGPDLATLTGLQALIVPGSLNLAKADCNWTCFYMNLSRLAKNSNPSISVTTDVHVNEEGKFVFTQLKQALLT
jgi:hypothetical protein